MTSFKKNMVFAFILYPVIIFSSPYQYRRILLIDNNRIIKTVDLISDLHDPLHEIVSKPSRKRSKLTPEEKTSFTSAERTLLITLRKLTEEKRPIELLWEESIDRPKFKSPTALNPAYSCQLNSNDRMKDQWQWMEYSNRLKNEFNLSKGSSVIYKNTDTYRPLTQETDIYNLLPHETNISVNILEAPFKNIVYWLKSLLDPHHSKVIIDLENIKKNYFNNYFDHLYAFWKKFAEEKVRPLYEFLNIILQKNPHITIKNFKELIKKQNQEYRLQMLLHGVFQLPDAEILIKLFGSSYDHSIVYAGGSHCDIVADYLITNFNGIEVINLGTDSHSTHKYNFSPVLLARTWLFLEETPLVSFNRYKRYGMRPVINLASDTLWNDFVTLRDELSVKPKRNEENTYNKLVDFYKKSSKTFIDFINVRDDQKKTLLFYAITNNLLKIAHFLLQHGARVNIQDSSLQTPLHYAMSDEALILLLEHGAKTNIKDSENNTAVDRAQKYFPRWLTILEEFNQRKRKKALSRAMNLKKPESPLAAPQQPFLNTLQDTLLKLQNKLEQLNTMLRNTF